MSTAPIPTTFLGHRVALTQFELSKPEDAVPANVREEWLRFLQAYQAADGIWTIHRACEARPEAPRQGWSGFALVRGGQIVRRFEF